jgi:pyruvate ferredoxin oxidoreductase alpha subunit
MVCMDGFVLTHAFEEVDLPEQDQVDRFLPPLRPQQALDPDHPVTIGTMVGPEAFTEVRYLAHLRHQEALALIPQVAAEFEASFGRPGAGLLRPYRCDAAGTVVVAMGSVLGTLAEVVDERRDAGRDVGALGITSFRPFPAEALRAALDGVRRVVVLERSIALGNGGVVSADVREALAGRPVEVVTVVAGLGGRPITKASLHGLLDRADGNRLEPLSFLDLDQDVVARELARRGPRSRQEVGR